MRIFKLLAICALLALLLVPAAVFAQEQAAPEHGFIEFGVRGVAGEVYGRDGQPGTLLFSNGFRPDLLQSSLNSYTDNRTGFYIPRFDAHIDSVFGSRNYLTVKSASNGFAFEGGGTLQRDQSVLASFGQYGHYKVQFRYDQTPHIFSGTTQTLFTSGGQGVWALPASLQAAAYACLSKAATGCPITNAMVPGFTASAANSVIRSSATLSALSSGTLVAGMPGVQLLTQEENRRAITGSMGWNITPDINLSGLFSREHQVGTRPIGLVIGTSSTGYMIEAPEQINYYTDTVRVAGEFGRKAWDALVGYQGSFFHNGTPSMLVTNPFSTVYTTGSSYGAATTRMDLYPDNQYHQLVTQGALELGKHVDLMANITPGFLRQNASFQPLTTNPNVTANLPAPSLNGQVDTLAMNYTGVLKATKSFKVVAKYQHYTYDDSTPVLSLYPVTSDIAPSTSPVQSWKSGSFTTRLFDIGGTWFFTKKNSVKFGYQRGWMDRIDREVAESNEDTLYGALDMQLHKTVMLRISGRHQNRVPQDYEVDTSNYDTRMVDQAARVRNRGDLSLSWDPTQKLSIYGFWGTLQDNYNQKGGVNSLLPLGDASISPVLVAGTAPTPIYGPYYAYGVLNSIGRNYGGGANYAITPKVVLFAEYAREKNTGVAIEGRGFNPTTLYTSGPLIGTPVCTRTSIPVTLRDGVVTSSGTTTVTPGVVYSGGNRAKECDPINDLYQASKDVVNNYYVGVDFTTKKVDLSLYYGLSAGQSFLFADGVNCQVGENGPNSYCGTHFANWKLDYLTSGDTTAGKTLAQVAADPQRTYYAYGTPGAGGFGFPQKVSRIHDVGAIVRFKLTNNLIPKFQYVYQQNDYNDWQTQVNPFSYLGLPYSYAGYGSEPLGAGALNKMLWLGADNPSYRAHIFSATLEYHF